MPHHLKCYEISKFTVINRNLLCDFVFMVKKDLVVGNRKIWFEVGLNWRGFLEITVYLKYHSVYFYMSVHAVKNRKCCL